MTAMAWRTRTVVMVTGEIAVALLLPSFFSLRVSLADPLGPHNSGFTHKQKYQQQQHQLCLVPRTAFSRINVQLPHQLVIVLLCSTIEISASLEGVKRVSCNRE